MQNFRFEGLSLTVDNVERSVAFYVGALGLQLAYDASPAFAMIRSADGGTIGLLALEEAAKEGVAVASDEQRRGIHVELIAAGVLFQVPPHDEPWERSMTAYDPDGHCVEFSQGRRGIATPRR